MRRMALLLILALIALSACGKAAQTVAEKAAEKAAAQATGIGNDGSLDISSGSDEEGVNLTGTNAETGEDVELQMGATEVPAEFPMPLPDNAEVTDVSWITIGEDTAYTVILNIDPQDQAEILDFYEAWINDNGMEVIRSSDTVIGTGDSVTAIVGYTDYGDYAEVTLSWSPNS